jgi:hypothetical protein
MGLKDWFKSWFPSSSYDDLRKGHYDAARALARDEARDGIERNPILLHPASAQQRAEIVALISGPFGQAEHARSLELLRAALEAQSYLLRPGTVEDVWALEGLFNRLLDP